MTSLPRAAEPLVNDALADEELRQRVILHLASCRPELERLIVTVNDGCVTLSGEVNTFFLRQLAIERTRHIAGVRLLVDHIEVPAFVVGLRKHAK
jgi:osmotically-inducible protein OsmY